MIDKISLKQIINRLYGKMSKQNFIYADTDSLLYSDCDFAQIPTLFLYLFKED